MNTLPKRSGQRRFFYHYNKPESMAQGCNVLTLHWKGECHLVNDIVCYTPTETHKQKRQPHCVVRGWAAEVEFRGLGYLGGDTAIVSSVRN
jgi:hypothetical protein